MRRLAAASAFGPSSVARPAGGAVQRPASCISFPSCRCVHLAQPDVRLRQEQQRAARRRQVGASAGSRRSRPTIRSPIHAEVAGASSGAIAEPDARAARRSGSRRCSISTHHCAAAAQEPDACSTSSTRRAARRSRTSSGRRCSTSRRRSSSRTTRSRAKCRTTRKAPSGSSSCPSSCAGRSCTWASTPRSASIATSSGSPPSGPSCTRCSRSRARASSSARSCRAARGGSTTTIEHEYLVALLLQLMNAGNMTARHLEWVAGELDEWCAPLRLSLEPSSVTSFYVDLGIARRPAPPHARAARGTRAVPRHAAAALGAACRTC